MIRNDAEIKGDRHVALTSIAMKTMENIMNFMKRFITEGFDSSIHIQIETSIIVRPSTQWRLKIPSENSIP